MDNGIPTQPPGEEEFDDEFGSCCEELREAMEGEEFEPLIAVGEDGVLYLSVGMVDLEDDDEPGMVDHPLFFCPFCGTEVQTEERVAELVGTEDDEDGNDNEEDSKDDGAPGGGTPPPPSMG